MAIDKSQEGNGIFAMDFELPAIFKETACVR
jgi:hypothetical protein